MPMNINVDTIVKRFEHIKANRQQWDNHWQECMHHSLPQKAIVTERRAPGTKIKTDIYDSTAVQSVQVLAAGLHSYLTNPTSKWFALGMEDEDLGDNHEVKEWLQECEDKMFSYLNNSNFNQQIHECYIDFSSMGTSALYEEEDIEDGIKFFTRPMVEVYILVNARGRVDTVYREFTYTARQAYQRWGENCGQKVKDLLAANKVEEIVSFLHVVLPREERNVRKKDARNMPFASLYIEPDKKKILSEGGYEEFPFMIPRFYKVSDSEYAYSPTSMCLADIKMLNSMSKTTIKGAQKMIDPPIILPHDGYLLPFKNTAGGINFKLSGSADDKVETLDIRRDIGLGLELENQRRESIRRAYFVDLFLMLSQQPKMTATEVLERVNEKMLILGPVLGRLMHELLNPIIIRTFNILMRNGKLPQPPEAVRDEDYKIEYISPLAKAQKASEAKSISSLLLAVQEMAAVEPAVLDNIDFDEVVKQYGEIYNTSAKVLRSDEEVKELRKFKAEQAQAQAAMEQLPPLADAAKTVVEAGTMLKGGEKVGAK